MNTPQIPIKNRFQRYFGVATLESAETTLEFFVGLGNYWRKETLPQDVIAELENDGFHPSKTLNLFIIDGIGYTLYRFQHDGEIYGVIINRRVNPVTMTGEWRVWPG